MLKVTENQTAHASHIIVEADFSKHLPTMKRAYANGDGKEAGFAIAKASIEETETSPEAQEKLSTTDKFFRNLYESTPEDKKAERLLSEFHEESNGIKRVLRQIGFKGLQVEYNRRPHNPREHNLSLLRRD